MFLSNNLYFPPPLYRIPYIDVTVFKILQFRENNTIFSIYVYIYIYVYHSIVEFLVIIYFKKSRCLIKKKKMIPITVLAASSCYPQREILIQLKLSNSRRERSIGVTMVFLVNISRKKLYIFYKKKKKAFC